MPQLIFTRPNLMWKVIHYHFNFNHVVAWWITPSQHIVNHWNIQIIWPFLWNGITNQNIKWLLCIKHLGHINNPNLQIVIHLNIHSHHIIQTNRKFWLLFFIKLGEHIFKHSGTHIVIDEVGHVCGKHLVFRGILLYQVFVSNWYYVIVGFVFW